MTMSNISVLSDLPATLAAQPLDQAQTIIEFCTSERISKSLYFKLKRAGRGPREMRPGGNVVRISPQARRDWRAEMEAEAQTKDAVLERQRRVEQRRAAGKAAAESPTHVSNAGPRLKKRARR